MTTGPTRRAFDDGRNRLQELIARLDPPAEVRLLTGGDVFELAAEAAIGLEPVAFSDGPTGVRGPTVHRRLGGRHLPRCDGQDHVINEIVKGEWGFDGLVMSDWIGTEAAAPAAGGGLDLVGPGPVGPGVTHWSPTRLPATG